MTSAESAFAESPFEYPSQGSESLGRGGAWVARAADPAAISRNPAALAGQVDRVSFGYDFAVRHLCFTRTKAANDPTLDGVAPGGSYPEVCDIGSTLPVGYLAIAHRITPRLAIGGGILTPSGVPRIELPQFIANGVPAPQRYLLLDATTLMAIPTLSAAYEVLPSLRVGASLGWGVAYVRTTAAAPGVIEGAVRPADNDVKVRVSALDAFVPRATIGAHFTASENVEVGASFGWSDKIDAYGDARTEANAFTSRVASGDTSKIARGDTAKDDCGRPGSIACREGNRRDGGNAHLVVPLPLSAALGVRYRVPRHVPIDARRRRSDPIDDEVFDIEFNASWSGASAPSSDESIRLRFPSDPANANLGTIPVVGTAGTFPPNNDSLRRYRDSITFHLGADLVVIARRLSLRVGSFLQSPSGIPGFVGLESFSGRRVGLASGLTFRVGSNATRSEAIDVSLGYLHMLVSDVVVTSPSAPGIPAAAGSPPYRTPWAISLGRIETGLDVLHLGAAYRF